MHCKFLVKSCFRFICNANSFSRALLREFASVERAFFEKMAFVRFWIVRERGLCRKVRAFNGRLGKNRENLAFEKGVLQEERDL